MCTQILKTTLPKTARGHASLPDKIDTITGFEWGTSVSPENIENGYTHCFLLNFEDEDSRDIYLPHPAYLEFVDEYLPILNKVVMCDSIHED